MNLSELITKLLLIERQLVEEEIEVNKIKSEITLVTNGLLQKPIIDVFYYKDTNSVIFVYEI